MKVSEIVEKYKSAVSPPSGEQKIGTVSDLKPKKEVK
jgi:hypothetical protein